MTSSVLRPWEIRRWHALQCSTCGAQATVLVAGLGEFYIDSKGRIRACTTEERLACDVHAEDVVHELLDIYGGAGSSPLREGWAYWIRASIWVFTSWLRTTRSTASGGDKTSESPTIS